MSSKLELIFKKEFTPDITNLLNNNARFPSDQKVRTSHSPGCSAELKGKKFLLDMHRITGMGSLSTLFVATFLECSQPCAICANWKTIWRVERLKPGEDVSKYNKLTLTVPLNFHLETYLNSSTFWLTRMEKDETQENGQFKAGLAIGSDSTSDSGPGSLRLTKLEDDESGSLDEEFKLSPTSQEQKSCCDSLAPQMLTIGSDSTSDPGNGRN